MSEQLNNARKMNVIDAAGGLYHVRKYSNAWVPVAIVNNCRHTGAHCGTSYAAMQSAIDLCARLSVDAMPPEQPRPAKQLDIFDNGSASQVGERQIDLEDLIEEKKQEQSC